MKFLKFAAVPALALALVGCGKSDAPASCCAGKVYEPQVAEGTQIAVCYRENTAAALAPVMALFKENKEKAMASAPEDATKFLADAGLTEADVKWSLVTVPTLDPEALEKGEIPGLAVAVSVKHDIAKLVAAIKAQAQKEGEDLVEAELAGVKIWKPAVKNEMPAGLSPCGTSLDGTLLLVAPTETALAREIALYRDGKGASTTFPKVGADKSEVLRVVATGLAPVMAKIAEEAGDNLAMLNMMVPNAKDMIAGLNAIDLKVAGTDEAVTLGLSLATAKADDAKTLATMANAALPMAIISAQNAEDEDAKMFLPVLRSIKVEAKEADLTVSAAAPADVIKASAEAANAMAGAMLGGEDDDEPIE